MPKAFPENAPGPFYVEQDCCITCGVPMEIAPDIFDWSANQSHCFVRRQPATADELDRTLQAMWSAEAECIRYRGADPLLADRIAQFGLGRNCDNFPGGPRPDPRTRATFQSARDGDTPESLAARLRAFLSREQPDRYLPYDVRPARRWRPATVRFSWDKPLAAPIGRRAHYNDVRFGHGPGPNRFNAVTASGLRGAAISLALLVHDWLRDEEKAGDIRWFARRGDWASSSGWHLPL